MGKYIVEIPDEDESFVDEENVITRAGDAFNVTGIIQNLEPYMEDAIRQSGAEEAWKFAASLLLSEREGGIPLDAFANCFGEKEDSLDIIKNYSYTEVVQKYKEWKRKKEEILVGDEVTFQDENHIRYKGVLLEKDGLEWMYSFIFEDGSIEQFDRIINPQKTSRHFDEIEELLKRMKKQ